MLSKKTKVRNIRNVLESPFQVLWSENTTEETSALQDLLRELLPCARLKEASLRCKTKPITEAKEGEVQIKENSIYRNYLAPGFQSVIRGLEKKELCCCILSADINPALIQKVVLTYAHASQTPIVVIPDLKSITKTALGFATMVLGVKNVVAESPENKFFPIYKMVSLTPAHIKTSLVPRTKECIATEQHSMSYSGKHANVPKEIKVKYLYREKTNERVFIPEFKNDEKHHSYSKVNKPEEFISFGERQQAGKTILDNTLLKADKVKYQHNDLDDVDDVDSEDEGNIFFIDNKPDKRLLKSKKEKPSISIGNEHSINKSKSNQNRPKAKHSKQNNINQTANAKGISHKFSAVSSSESGEHVFKNIISKKTPFKKSPQQVIFKPLNIKTVTSNSKKKKRNKKKHSVI